MNYTMITDKISMIHIAIARHKKIPVGGHGHEKMDTGVHVHVTDMVIDTENLKIVTLT